MLESDLATRPGAHLYYPGSTAVSRLGANQTPTEPGEEPNPAYVGSILTARVTPVQLYGWYARRLAALGYEPAAYYRPASQLSGWAWQRHHRLQIQVGIFDQRALQLDQGLDVALPAGAVIYEELIVGYPPGLPKD